MLKVFKVSGEFQGDLLQLEQAAYAREETQK